ncbi:MAG: hypothetical protein AB7U34_02685 [Novosphingobium sp.]
MLPVLITIDTEYSLALYQQGDGRDRATNFVRSIACRSSRGSTGINYQMRQFNRFGLKGVFFVDPMPAMIWGQEAVDEVVHTILEHGHEVQLHLHSEWLEFAEPRARPVGRTGANIKDFTLDEQVALLEYAIERLVAAGADRPIAFRAGNYGANDDTLRALARLGLVYDSSFAPGIPGSACELWLDPAQLSPILHCGLTEMPIGVIGATGGGMRHAQITALSQWELRRAVAHATSECWPAFVIVSHSFELFDRARGIPNGVVRRRFDRFCKWLGAGAGTTTFSALRDKAKELRAGANVPMNLLPHNPVTTAHRMVEQAVVNHFHSQPPAPPAP